MLKILIPVDGSEHASHAIDTVGKMARSSVELEATLMCVRTGTVLEPLFANDYSMIAVERLDKEQEDHQTAVLNDASKRARELGLKTGESIRAYGPIAPEIVRHAKERQVDLIAMGTRGLGAIGSMLLGSVAQKVLHESAVPVLLVR